ncbi:hypothetical protein [Chromobacterium violaceum]|uniref:hypothetical protein n=1 Tax=Chromobacterium violaceum TaxID=536 RepID=UPI00194F829E|nr:hypothetical protein [Chromobacterium violaceum]QRO32599.1 hypothetical protein I6K04_19330 [Chromobacterium violaceum]QRQ17600.1 hypothetical protein I6K03_03395 [Chromobacterium violaceum]
MKTTFKPEKASPLVPWARKLRQDYGFDEHINPGNAKSSAYLCGSLEGDMAFALAAAGNENASDAIRHCQEQLILRLGITGANDTIEDTRLRGWIVGLFNAMALMAEDIEAGSTPAIRNTKRKTMTRST